MNFGVLETCNTVCIYGAFDSSKQEEKQEVQEFKQTVTNYRPHLLNLESASANCCTPPPTPGGPKPTKPDQTASEVAAELQVVWDRYNSLETVATERGAVLAEFLPSVQQHESSQEAWLRNLETWEKRVSELSLPGTKPVLVDQQIREIKVCVHIIVYILDTCLCHLAWADQKCRHALYIV